MNDVFPRVPMQHLHAESYRKVLKMGQVLSWMLTIVPSYVLQLLLNVRDPDGRVREIEALEKRADAVVDEVREGHVDPAGEVQVVAPRYVIHTYIHIYIHILPHNPSEGV